MTPASSDANLSPFRRADVKSGLQCSSLMTELARQFHLDDTIKPLSFLMSALMFLAGHVR